MSSAHISLVGATLMNINLMVGASAFLAPAIMAHYAGPASFYGWLFAGVLFFPIVWCIAEITRYFPGQGSFYSYSKTTLSRSAGFVSGWVYFLGYVSIGSLQLMSLMRILTLQLNWTWGAQHALATAVLLILGCAALSLSPLRLIDHIQSTATLYKLLPLIIGVASLLIYFSPANTPSIFSVSPQTLLPTIPMAIFGFWGFEGVCSITHLIKDSARNARHVIFTGFIATVIIYTLFHLSVLTLLGPVGLEQQGAASFVSAFHLTSPLLQQLLNVLVISAIIVAHINAIFGGIIANSAMLCAMAEEKLFFMSDFFSLRFTATNRPLGATLMHVGGLIACVALVGNVSALNAMANIGVLLAFVLTIISLFRRAPKSVGSTIACFLGLASCALLIFYSWQGIGSTTLERMHALIPFMIAIACGIALHVAPACTSSSSCPRP